MALSWQGKPQPFEWYTIPNIYMYIAEKYLSYSNGIQYPAIYAQEILRPLTVNKLIND